MKKRSGIVLLYGVMSVASTLPLWASSLSTLQVPSPFSPARIPLQWSVDQPLEDATYAIYYRMPEKGTNRPWELVAGLGAVSATKGFFEGEHGKEYEFRSAVFSKQGSDMVTLADFDYVKITDDYYITPDAHRIFPACSSEKFRYTIFHNADEAIQGTGCYHFTFESIWENKESVPPSALFGLRFVSDIPARDWSPYRYLEMYFRSTIPGGMDIWIETREVGIRVPILRFSEDGVAPGQWHSILVDLNEVLGDPQARDHLQTLAFVKHLRELEPSVSYDVQIDAVRLWRDRSFTKTTVDTTEPLPPENVQSNVRDTEIIWTWNPSTDDLSDIAGYAVQFTNDRRQELPREIMLATPSIAIPYFKKPVLEEYYFRVAACNRAGLWSPVVERGITLRP